MLSGTTGDLTILSNFNGFGDIICHNILTSNIISSYSGGDITFNNGIALGSNTINSGNIISTGFLNVNNIISNTTTGSYQSKIALSNEFIDTGNSSLDIIATYIGFASPTQTLSTASKYMYIKPSSTGDFEIKINNISNVVLGTDWSQLATGTQMTTSWYSTAGVLMGFVNPNPPAGTSPTFRIMGTPTQYIFYNTSNTFGQYDTVTSTTNWNISNTGIVTCNGLNANSGNIQTAGTVLTNLINPNSGTTIASASIWNFKDAVNTTNIILNPTAVSGNRLQIDGVSAGTTFLYYNTSNVLAVFNSISGANVWSINGTTGNINTIGSVLTNTINPNSGTTISSTSIWNFKNGTYTPILLDPTTTSGNRLKIDGTLGGTRYLFFNTSSNIGVFNTATGANVWSIDGTTGNINTIGTISYSTLTTNLINASTGTNSIQMDNRFFNTGVGSIDLKATYIGFPQLSQTLSTASKYMAIIPQSDGNFHMSINNIGSRVLVSDWANLILFSEFNQRFMKSAGNSRILMFNTSTSGDIFQICRTGANAYTDGYWYHNNTGNFGYNTGGVSVWELLNTGVITTNGGFISNGTQNNFNSSGLRAIYVPNGAIETYRLFVNESSNSAISVPNGGVTAYRMIANNYIQCLGQYIYCQHNLINDIAGLWSNRTGSSGSGLDGNANNWVSMGGMENNNGMAIGYPAYNYYGTNRVFMWMIENTVSSGKALGLAINKVNAPNSYINATNQSTGFALLGFFGASYRGAAAYSFTGEHSSMVCDEEYNDLMNYNTDDFIGMVVCSSGKIYNLPYTPDGDTYSKQVDNIKSIDAQPMTRLSKKYKDKSVLGVISHIEKVGKNRNDINATSWTGCMALDKDERRRIRVASIGEGGIWITNEYGNIENGDYITTSNIAGYSTKQDDDLMHNYTIAKATMDCSFDIEKPDDYKTKYLGDGVYASYIACTFHCG